MPIFTGAGISGSACGTLLIALELPWPPSINNYYQRTARGVFLSKRARSYRTEVGWLIKSQGVTSPLLGKLEMVVYLYPPDARDYDMDNLLKALWDALEHGGVYDNDTNIKSLTMKEKTIGEGLVEVFIRPLP